MFEQCFAVIDIPNKDDHRRALERAFFKAMKADLSTPEMVQQALRDFSQQQRAAIQKKQQQQAKDVLALAKNKMRVDEQAKTTKTRNEALARMLNTRNDGRSLYQSVESKWQSIYGIHGKAVINDARMYLLKKSGWVVDKARELEVLKGLYGEAGNPVAKKFSELAESLRQRANKAGLDIGMLEKWGLPQAWDSYRVADAYKRHPDYQRLDPAAKAKMIGNGELRAKMSREMFVKDFFERADREAYNSHLGRIVSDDELKEYIKEAWRSIYYDGENKQAPRGAKSGLAKALNAERQLFIDKADGFQALNDAYGVSNTLELMDGHLQQISKVIALAEEFGPNADRVIKKMIDDNVQAATEAGLPDSVVKSERSMGNAIEAELDLYLGRRKTESMRVARAFAAIRNLQVLKLGGASISSITDNGTVLTEALFGAGSPLKFYGNRIAQMKNPKAAKFAVTQAGLAADVIYHNAYSSWSEMMARGWTGAAASATNTLSALNMLTRGRKEAFRMMRLNAITEVVKREGSIPDDFNGKVMKAHGITDTDFAIYKAAAKGKEIITPDDIRNVQGFDDAAKESAAERLVGMIIMDSSKAIIEQSGWARMITKRGANVKGTWRGELWESFFMFKGYPINAVIRMIDGYRMRGGYSAAAYTATSVILTTMFGAAAIQIGDFVRGKNPRPMNDPRFGLAAFLKGGAAGIFGDYLFAQQRYGASVMETLAGPVFADAAKVIGMIPKITSGDGEDVAGDVVRLARTNTPFLGLWYTSAVVDHLVTYQVQDMLSPGYTSRMERRAKKEFGQSYWWSPRDTLPEEAPDLTEAIQ